MKIDYMKEYVSLVKTCNFSQTAQKLFISQSSLSRHLAIIEDEIGAQLLVRSTHSVRVTPVGQMVFEEFQIILNHYHSIIEKASLDSIEFVGELEIGAMYYAMDDYMRPIISLFKKKHPKVNLILDSLQPYEIIDNLKSQKIDIGLVIFTDNLDQEKYVFERVRREKLIIVSPVDQSWEEEEMILRSQLSSKTLVLCQSEKYYNQYLQKIFAEYSIDFKNIVMTEQIDSLKSALMDVNGYSILPYHMKTYYQNGFRISEIEDEKNCLYVDIGFVYRLSNENTAIPLFIKEINNYYGENIKLV